MPLPSSGIIVVEKPSSASSTIINNSTTAINTVNNSSLHPPQEQTAQQTQIQYYEYYDVNENQQQQQYHHQQQQQQQQQQQHSTIVVDGTVYHQQQQLQLGGSSSVAIGRKIHNSSSTSSTSSTTSSSSSSSTALNKPNLHIQTLKTVPMPQTKQYSQQQQIIQHTSHTTTATATTTNPQHHLLHQQPQHVQQINLAASSIHHQTQHHHTQHQPTPTAHMIQVSEEFLEQAANNHNTSNMMISTTGEVINQQQIFKIVSTDGTTGNMIIDATNQNANTTTTTSKVLLSNLTVLSKQPTTAQGQIIGSNHHQAQTAGQTINFVNAKNLYTTSTTGGNIASGGKQQKFTVSTASVANYKGSAIKQTSSAVNTQYLQQSNALGQHKINMTAGNRNMQMLTTARIQSAASSNSNISNSSNVALISNNAATAQTMVLQQQPQKFIANNTAGAKTTPTALNSGGGNIIKKSTTAGTLRMNNSNNTSATTKLMNNLQTTQGVKTFITQTPSLQQQQHTQQNINQLTLQHHTTKCGGKSKFAKQYNNAILNSAGAVAIATLPHQQSNSHNSLQIQQQQQQQQHQQLQPQTTYINHHKISGGGSTKINKISSKYAQSVNVAAQLPPGTQLHQKSINQTHQQQFQTTNNNNSNIKFVNAQGTIIQQQQQPHQQSLTPQKFNNKHHHHQQQQQQQQQQQKQYQNLQNYDIVDGNHLYNQTSASPAATGVTSSTSSSCGTTSLSSASSLLTDDIMMVNGTQMTDELSARILQSMSQKSFGNQRYQQQQQHVFQTKTTTTTPLPSSSPSLNSNNNSNSNNNNMLPPPPTAPQNTLIQTNNNTNSNILLSPREYTLYPTTAAASTIAVATPSQQQQPSPIHYNSATNPTATATASSNITAAGSFSSNNYITVSNNNSNNMTTITPHTTGTLAANSLVSNNTSSGLTSTVRQAQSAPNSRSQSMERKLHESSMSRKSTEYYKVNNHNSLRGSHQNNLVQAAVGMAPSGGSLGMASASASNPMGGVVSASIPPPPSPLPMPRPPSIPPSALIMEPQAQVIHLQATKTLPGANNSSNDDDDDIIGEEIRPALVETEDIRLRILHAVLFDHTYVNPMPMELPTTFAVQLPPTPNANASASASALTTSSSVTGHSQQWSLGGIGAVAAVAGTCGVVQQNYALYGSQLSRLQQDEDSYSAVNTSSRLAVGDIDPGEETETAPEAELEDDSITRCICDLTHDDGYMICCDKCCAWQHVDCMGIDRQNIPDEYLCELCQPRAVDKARARSLQLMKRKEQQQQLMLTAQAQAVASAGTMGAAGSANGASVGGVANLLPNDGLGPQQRLSGSTGAGFNLAGNMAAENAALQLLAASSNLKKGTKILKKVKDGVSGKRSKKAEKLAAAAAAGLSTSGKPARKETKKNTKRKKAGAHDSVGSTVGMTAAEKHAANLRQWIENYELAVTNHYSPELRARLHAITKQPSLLQSILNTENPILKEFSNGSLENRATTVPHAGGKILISNLDIIPNSPICELRGKYMLTTQYKTQNTSMNMNSPPPNNYHLASYKAHKTPGPFIFFYQLPGTEVTISQHLMSQTNTTTTLNLDGTYTTTTTTLPAQQSPPTFLKGPEICVDTRTYGNEARFVRRSCRPNAEIQHLFEKGTIHLFIVALTDIRASTEITIRHEPHDLLAVENKKSSSMVIQPTSTPCACGLTKDCLFGPPLPQLPPAAKSNAGRKSLTHSGGGSGNAGNLTAKQRKANQQNLNRNRSISSSASGDSNMGTTVTTTTNTVAMGLNSPSKIAAANKMVNTLMPLTASCNSNSSSSTLTSIMPDSGICTSSSSPSVSIPSPTQHMHSPIQQQQVQQQQQQVQQQQHQQQLLHNAHMRSPVQLLPQQQQQQQLMQSLPTPLMLTSPSDMVHHSHHQQQQQQQQQQQLILEQPAMITQQQPLSVIAQPTTITQTINTCQDVFALTEQPQQPPPVLCVPIQAAAQQPPLPSQEQTQQHQIQQQQLLLQEQQQHQVQLPASQPTPSVVAASTGLLETVSPVSPVSPEATIAAAALQSLNTAHSPNISVPTTSPVLSANVEPQQIQNQQFVLIPATEATSEQLQQHQHQHQQQQTHQPNQTPENLTTSTSSVPSSLSSSPQQLQQQQQPQQTKSPQKNNYSQQNTTHPGRKTLGKHGRTTSISEDNEQHHHNEDNSVASTPTSSSTPKEKPKLSREDRKMEAILRAIEKMERSQQRKQEQHKATKRQNSNSHNTTPTSPNKSFESGENASGGSRRSNSHTGTVGRSKKKRKAGAKGGQGASYNNQRKRRQSRMNSQESVESSPHDHDAITSESDGCAALHSPPIQTMASARQSSFSTPTTSSAASHHCTVTATRPPNETITNNVDQAAGLLMAFANPNISPVINSSPVPTVVDQHIPESPNRCSQYMTSNEAAASSPPTPPSHVSSACLLIEAAVGPLESNLDGNSAEVHNSEFKYPLQAKTKKHLMNNWLHQEEENTHESNVTPLPEPTPQSSHTAVTSAGCSGVPNVPLVSGGLDSLLQAAMSDLKQSQSEAEQPQNLSIAAQKVEEFIQQTEASVGVVPTPTLTKHSYDYDQHQHQYQQIPYVSLPIPAVDLTLKTPLTIGPNPSSSNVVPSMNRNFNLPLQVSTCSNNSSVKKRWLRQAISEETHEEFQNSFSMSPSSTTSAVNNTFAHAQLQPIATCSPANTATNHIPNGFATPLKKRRLLLTGKDEVDESISQNCGELSATATPSPPPAPAPHQSQQPNQITFSPLKDAQEEFEIREVPQDLPFQNMHEDVDVDVEKCEMSEAQVQQTQDQEHQLQPDRLNPKIEMDQEQDVDVTTSPLEDEIKIETIIKHEDAHVQSEVKEESSEVSVQQTDIILPAEFNDQDDDVDILRSPSPGREMIKAEDNLVKIEPEDISGTEDVKIDVEREESMAADDVVVLTQHKERKEDIIVPTQEFKDDVKINNHPSSLENVENNQEVKLENTNEEHVTKEEQSLNRDIELGETKRNSHANLGVKSDHESHTQVEEPKPKRLKLEKSDVDVEKLVCVKEKIIKPETPSADEVNTKQEKKSKIEAISKVCQRQEVAVAHSASYEVEKVLTTESAKIEKQPMGGDIAEVTSSSSSTLLAVRTVAADTTFADVEVSTPPPLPTTTIVGGTAAPIQRHKSLSDDDIQARLHSFHKENILFLQSRNKKTKSSSCVSANSNINSSSTNCLTANNDHHKNRISSSSSSNHQNHHNDHHYHHEGKEKSDKSSSKRHKSSATPTGSSKKPKLHKRERTTSSSSLNSHTNSTTPQISSSSSSSLLNKDSVINSTTNFTGSSKKLKSLKKSSSGSSTSSNTSTSSYSNSTLALQNCYPSSSSTAATTPLNSDKEKHQRQRTTSSSSSNNNVASNNSHATPTTPYPSSKKRQLNFELELTKDMHLLNSAVSGGSKHKREASRLVADEQGHVAAKKSRKETTKEELKNGTNKQLFKFEKQQEKKVSAGSTAAGSTTKACVQPVSTTSQPATTTVTIPKPTISSPPPALSEEPKLIPTIVTQPPLSPTTSILREHPTLPNFNNVVITTSYSSTSHHQQQPPLPSVQPQPLPPLLPQNIPNHVNSPSFIASVQSNHNQQQSPLPPTPPPSGATSSPVSTPSLSTSNHLPFYNTIYGKLLDNLAQPPNLSTSLMPSNTFSVTGTTPPPIQTSASLPAAGAVLSEYVDTKLKSYNTLGGYVSHTALFGLNNATNIKDTPSNVAVVSSTTISTASVAVATNTPPKDSSTEMLAPLAPPPVVPGGSVALTPSGSNSGNSASTTTPLKIHTKTASHDPRLNPQLTAPEPPPQPKRKLSINEYRKRMQQSSSNDSISGSSSLTSTPTTPTMSLDAVLSSTLLAPTTLLLTNKCTLNSPDRLTQSVDSQIQKEIMSSGTAVTSSSSSDSLNSSNSSTSSSSLNDNLLKSSSFVEEDSTKGQFNAAPTLLEKQQESLCARLKSLKEKQSLGTSFSVGSVNRPRFSSFSESVASNDFGLRKDDDDMDIIRNRNLSISSSIGGGDLLDNCLEEISSTSTSMSSSREPSPERCYTSHHKILTASATTTMTNTSATSHSNNGQTTRHHQQQQQHHHTHHHQQQHINCDKNEIVNLERKKSVDIA